MFPSRSLLFVPLLAGGLLRGQPLPSAAEVLTKLADAYRAPQKYLFAGTATIEEPGGETRRLPFTLAIELPDKMRMEGDARAFGGAFFRGEVLFVSDGRSSFTLDGAAKKYYKVDRSSPPGSVGKFEGRPPGLDHPEQFVAYFHLFVTAQYGERVRNAGLSKVNGVETLTVEGKPVECYVIQTDRGAFEENKLGSSRDIIWVDPHRPAIWREDKVAWVRDGASEHTRTDFTRILLDEPLPEGTFVFRPPKGAKLTPIPARK